MGGSVSKPNLSSNPKQNLEIILDENVKEQLDKLNEYVDHFNKSDVKELMKVIDQYKSSFRQTDGNVFDLNNINTFIDNFYNTLSKRLQLENPGVDIDSKLKDKLNSADLPDYLKTIYDDNFQKLKQEINDSPIIQFDEVSKKNIDNIFNNITTLKSKYRYFEYKYIQLNIFMLIFIEHTFKTMDDFVDSIVSYVIEHDSKRSDTIRSIVSKLLNIINEADLKINKEDFTTLNNLMLLVKKDLEQKQTKLLEAGQKLGIQAKQNLASVIKQEADRFSSSQQVSHILNNPSDKPTSTVNFNNGNWESRTDAVLQKMQMQLAQQAQQAQQQTQQSDVGLRRAANFGAPNPLGQGQRGGFVRGNSRFPQAFYELNTRS